MNVLQKIRDYFRPKVSTPARFFGPQRFGIPASPPVTEESAESLAGYAGAKKAIADGFVSLPLCVYERTKNQGDVETLSHPVSEMIRDPHPDATWPTHQDAQVRSLLGGESFAEVIRGRRGRIYLKHRERVQVGRIDKSHLERGGELAYVVNPHTSDERFLFREDVVHIPWMSNSGVTGISALLHHHAVVQLGLSIEEFCKGYFYRGHHGGWLEYNEAQSGLNKGAMDELAIQFSETLGPFGKGIAHLKEGIKFHILQNAKPEDAQLLSTRRYSIGDIARIFNMPVSKLRIVEGQTHGNMEEETRDFARSTLHPISRRMCAEYDRKLFPFQERSRFYTAHNFSELLRADDFTQARIDAMGRQNGLVSANDVRRRKRERLIPAEQGGDSYAPSLAPNNMFGQGPEGETKGAPGKQASPKDSSLASLGPVFAAGLRSIESRYSKSKGPAEDRVRDLLQFSARTLAPSIQALALQRGCTVAESVPLEIAGKVLARLGRGVQPCTFETLMASADAAERSSGQL